MLTADLVRASVRDGALVLRPLSGKTRTRALELAAAYLEAASRVGVSRQELDAAFAAIPASARERKLADGLKKLVLDRCELEAATTVDPVELRRELFLEAASARLAVEATGHFDRDAVLATVAARRAASVDTLEQALFADLRQEQRLLAFERTTPEALVEHYDRAQEQAVLLRAEYLEVDLFATDPGAYRYVFRKLKFLRLLHTIERLDAGYRIRVDGPYSMFSAITKYGLQLAMLVPALRHCERFALRSTLRWGSDRRRVDFVLSGGKAASALPEEPSLPDEVVTLLTRMQGRASRWQAAVSHAIFSLPGVGEIVPDLVFTDAERGLRIYLEVLGYWSRDAVFRRVELVQAGLRHPFLFAFPKRLRVGEEIVEDELPVALYPYKGTMSVAAIESRLERLAERLVDDPRPTP